MENKLRADGSFTHLFWMPYREEPWHDRGYLPHCDHDAFTQFITYRLHDSLPAKFRSEIADRNFAPQERRKAVETYLDSGYGSCLLSIPQNGDLIVENWKHFHERRYFLHAWCVMPNHVHVLIEPLGNFSTEQIVHSWKSYTSKRMYIPSERVVGGGGRRVWQTEYFDRFIRDERHFSMVRSYIHSNPMKAGLVAKKEDWPWSSATDTSSENFRS